MTQSEQDHETPAIFGGTPAFPEGSPAWPGECADVHESVTRALHDGSWGKYHGPNCEKLRELLCESFGFKHALLCSSGTIATEIALRGTHPGFTSDPSRLEVALAAYDFGGNFRAVDSIGSRPALLDIRNDNWCIDVDQLEESLSVETEAIIVSHLHGGLADMKRIAEIATSRGIQIIEDACQSPGARIGGEQLDGERIGKHCDAMTLSFGGSKLLTAGRGGAVLTNRDDVFQRAKIFCERGNDAFPLSELQAAALIPQLQTLPQQNQQRFDSVARLTGAAHCLEQQFPASGNNSLPVFFKLPWRFNPSFEVTRQEMIDALQAEGIAVDAGFRGFANRSSRRCRKANGLENSKRAAERTIVFHHPFLLQGSDYIQRAATAIEKVYRYFENRKSAS